MNYTKISKRLSFLLRHCTDPLIISLDGGWTEVDGVIKELSTRYPEVNREVIETIVAQDEKGRYSFSADGSMIRANQGHSIPGLVIKMETPEPPEFLYHGTASRFLDSILSEGLKPMSRQHVHISKDIETAVKVGKRHGDPVVLEISAKRFVEDGNKLYLSANGVWLAEKVPSEYFRVINF